MARRTQLFDPRQNMKGDTYEIFHYLDMASRHLEAHYHEFYEIFFFLDGEVDYWIDGSVYHLQAGDLLLIPPTSLHRPLPLSDSDVYERMVLWLNGGFLSSIQDGLLEKCFKGEQRLLRPDVSERGHLQSLARQLVKECYGNGYAAESCAYGLLLQLLTAVNRAARNEDAWDTDSTKTFITEVLDYIGAHFREPLSLDHLASHFYLNKYYLSHEFRKAVGTGIHRYITLKRLYFAYERLREGAPAGEVCEQCGFSDYTAFYKAFKAEYGISPAACKE